MEEWDQIDPQHGEKHCLSWMLVSCQFRLQAAFHCRVNPTHQYGSVCFLGDGVVVVMVVVVMVVVKALVQ